MADDDSRLTVRDVVRSVGAVENTAPRSLRSGATRDTQPNGDEYGWRIRPSEPEAYIKRGQPRPEATR
jgi:hypothetical protein